MTNDTLRIESLKSLRTLSGLSQREVAARMGVTRPRISQIEHDFPNIRFDVVQAYIRALGGRIEFSVTNGLVVRADEVPKTPDGEAVRTRHGDRSALRARYGQGVSL